MPLFKVQIFKTHPLNNNREWSNVYFVRCGSSSIAAGIGSELVAAEREFHNEATTFTRHRASSVTALDTDFVTVIDNEQGLRTNPANNLPLFNTVRVDVSVTGGGRPSRKFYRLPLGTGDVANLVVDSTLRSTIDTAMEGVRASLETAGTPLVDPDDQPWADVAAFQNVQERQLHRKRRKRVTP